MHVAPLIHLLSLQYSANIRNLLKRIDARRTKQNKNYRENHRKTRNKRPKEIARPKKNGKICD
jgi:hypothetical protein